MIKAVTTSLIVIFLFGAAPLARAQEDAASAARAAGEEAVRRQAKILQLRSTLADAQALRSRGELPAASKKYEEAYELVQSVGVNIDREQAETVQGLAETRLELAKRAQARGDLNEADEQVKRVLRVDPNNTVAHKFKEGNDKQIQERLGRQPSRETLELLPEVRQERINTSVLVNDARLLMEMGKLDEAEAKLTQATKSDPEHRAAFYYLTLIKEKRYAQEARKREVMAKEKIVEVETAWNTPIPRETLPMANPYARTNRIWTSSGRQAIQRKLGAIVIDNFFVPAGTELSEVVNLLNDEVKSRDPDRRGLNFIISSQLDRPAPNVGAAPGGFPAGNIDPLTGQPIAAAAPSAPIEIERFEVKIDPPLLNVTVADILDAISRVAKPPQGMDPSYTIKVSIEDYAVVFSQKGPEIEPLYVRTFKIDPNTFSQGLDGVWLQQSYILQVASQVGAQGGAGGGGGGAAALAGGGGGAGGGISAPGATFGLTGSIPGQQGGGGGQGGGGQLGGIVGVTLTNDLASIQQTVRNFFIAAGVNFPQVQIGGAPGAGFQQGAVAGQEQKAIFFNDRTGILFVRATLRDLDIIEGALQALNVTPSQVTIEVKIAEITQRDSRGVGFDWYLGNILMRGGKAGFQGGTAPSFADSGGAANPANPGGTFPGQFGNPAVLPNPDTDQLVTSGLGNNAQIPAIGTLTGILTDPQFRLVIRALEQREGVDLLSAPRITTVSGRQARISIEDTQTIIIGFGVQGIGGGGAGVGGGVGVVQ